MSRNKVARKSTWIDMTPFVDVAFLILSFFIMATKFKPEEAVKVETPSSVSSRELEIADDTFVVLLDSKGSVYGQVAPNLRKPIIENLNSTRNLNLNQDEIKKFINSGAVGSSYADMKKYINEPKTEFAKPGIPLDSVGGELYMWVRDINSLTQGAGQWYIKGDNAAKYPAFKDVLKALKKNEIFKFNLITATEPIPTGSALSEANKSLNK